jgi:hypothetical protein
LSAGASPAPFFPREPHSFAVHCAARVGEERAAAWSEALIWTLRCKGESRGEALIQEVKGLSKDGTCQRERKLLAA